MLSIDILKLIIDIHITFFQAYHSPNRTPVSIWKLEKCEFRMNSSYESKGVARVENMLNDYDILNETGSDNISVTGNDTEVTEDYDVKTYLESILGPQRQPNEKVHEKDYSY